jgi:large subunit ribosomal protein L7/L12
MTDKLEELKRKRDQLNARIQQQEARLRAGQKKAEDRVKVLVGAAILEQVRANQFQLVDLLGVMDRFLARPAERLAVLGEDGRGSAALHRVAAPEAPTGATPAPSQPQASISSPPARPGSIAIKPDSGEYPSNPSPAPPPARAGPCPGQPSALPGAVAHTPTRGAMDNMPALDPRKRGTPTRASRATPVFLHGSRSEEQRP